MTILPRRPTLIAVMCCYVVVSLVIVLVVFASSDDTERSRYETDMSTRTNCDVLGTTMSLDKREDGQCRYRVDVQYKPHAGTLINAVAYSGLVGKHYGDCDAAQLFSERFRIVATVPCWYNFDNTDQVRLWSDNEAGAAIPGDDDDDGATAAVTVVISLLAVIIVLSLLYAALRCGAFGEDVVVFRPHAYRAIPKEPGAGPATTGATTTMVPPVSMGGSPAAGLPVVPVHQPPQRPMVKVGLAQVPQHIVDDGYTPPDPLSALSPPPPHYQSQALYTSPVVMGGVGQGSPIIRPTAP